MDQTTNIVAGLGRLRTDIENAPGHSHLYGEFDGVLADVKRYREIGARMTPGLAQEIRTTVDLLVDENMAGRRPWSTDNWETYFSKCMADAHSLLMEFALFEGYRAFCPLGYCNRFLSAFEHMDRHDREYEDSYHVLPQYGYAELISKDGNPITKLGEIGEIVGTSFIMHATPFVRYRTSDLACLKAWECPSCGRPYQVWERIEGRLQEFVVTRTGRYVSMTAINCHDDIFDHIRQFQFHQRTRGQVTFRYIPKSTCNENALADIRRRLVLKFGDDVELGFEAVEDIPLTQRGKHRFLIQEIAVEFHDV